MYVADGGGGAAAPASRFTGTQTLHIEPSAIPVALNAFQVAFERVSRKIDELEGLPIKDWARDPVSSETATQFAERSNVGGGDSAITCLQGYQRQLKSAMDSLRAAHENYLLVEGDNTDQWGVYHQA